MKRSLVLGFLMVAAAIRPAAAQRWTDATPGCLGATTTYGNHVEVADLDGDGKPDILVANGGDHGTPGTMEPPQAWLNTGDWTGATGNCTEVSTQVFGSFVGYSRTIKAADIDGDGDLDILAGGGFQTQAKLVLRDGTGWIDASDRLPQQLTSIGDAEFGDVDGDGDLDLVIADWGAIPPEGAGYKGGRTRLYLNDGTGHFTDATETQMPDLLVKWSWDMELVDVDNDFDLDILVSCKSCAHQFLFLNDGHGTFTDASTGIPTTTNNYEFEPMDMDGDGFLDLMSIDDGPGSKSKLFKNNGDGTFSDATANMAATANPGSDDNAAVWLDVDDDGDADLLIISLSGPERLLLNDGTGHFTLAAGATPNDTPGSLGVALADFNGDGRIDVVQSQGEVAFGDKIQLAGAMVAVDTHPPIVQTEQLDPTAGGVVRARVHDRLGPSHLFDWTKVVVIADGTTEIPMQWYGEFLWRAEIPAGTQRYQVCGTDKSGNKGCGDVIGPDGPHGDPSDPTPDAGTHDPGDGGGGGCCEAGGSSPATGAFCTLAVLGWIAVRRRRTVRS